MANLFLKKHEPLLRMQHLSWKMETALTRSVFFSLIAIFASFICFSNISSADWTSDYIVGTIDHNKIDGNLSDFPVLIHLAGDSGTNSFDATELFNELPLYEDRKKIAVFDSDGNQCYVEIESWDHVNQEAWLWVRIPDVSSTENTELKIYFDSTQDDNDEYIGEILLIAKLS